MFKSRIGPIRSSQPERDALTRFHEWFKSDFMMLRAEAAEMNAKRVTQQWNEAKVTWLAEKELLLERIEFLNKKVYLLTEQNKDLLSVMDENNEILSEPALLEQGEEDEKEAHFVRAWRPTRRGCRGGRNKQRRKVVSEKVEDAQNDDFQEKSEVNYTDIQSTSSNTTTAPTSP